MYRPIDEISSTPRPARGCGPSIPFVAFRVVCVRACPAGGREVFLGTRGSRVGQKAPKERKVAELGWKKRSDVAAFCGLPADAQPSPPRRPPLVFSFSLSFPPQLTPLILRLPQVEGGGCGLWVGWRAPGLMWEEGPPAQREGSRLRWRRGRQVFGGDPGNPQKSGRDLGSPN